MATIASVAAAMATIAVIAMLLRLPSLPGICPYEQGDGKQNNGNQKCNHYTNSLITQSPKSLNPG